MPIGVYTRRPKPPAPSIPNADGSVSIPLMGKSGTIRAYAIVDADDEQLVSQFRWHLSSGYAGRSVRIDGQDTIILMHRQLLGLVRGDGLEGDHIDRDRLNNRRSNLRSLPTAGRPNTQNRVSHRGSASKYRGVSWHKRNQRWCVFVMVAGKHQYIGSFKSEDDAGAAAQEARARLMPYATN